jgi:hypothetical protein
MVLKVRIGEISLLRCEIKVLIRGCIEKQRIKTEINSRDKIEFRRI